MKKFSKIILVLCIIILSSCAKSKEFTISNQNVIVEPYGWANDDALKNDSIVYEVNAGNVILSIIFCETIVVPIWLTGWQMKEPVRKIDSQTQTQ